MGVQDRDWYREELRRKEKLHYNPKAFRRSRSSTTSETSRPRRPLGPVSKILIACIAAICLAVFVSQWRRQEATSRGETERLERAQKLRLQAAEQERAASLEQQARRDRVQQEEAARLRSIAAQREARSSTIDEENRRKELWAKFYKPDPTCEGVSSMDCTNAYIRARRRFDELYSKSRI